MDFRRGEAGARLGTRTEGPVSFAGIATTGPVGFQAGLGGIDSDAYDPWPASGDESVGAASSTANGDA